MLLRYYTPAWLYESLPYLYLLSGALAMYATGNVIGLFFGALLVAVALFVWQMRHAYRRHTAARRRMRATTATAATTSHQATRPAPTTSAVAGAVSRIAWSPTFEIGHPVIDRQHRLLFMRANELVAAALTDQPDADIALMLDELVLEIDRHFRTEDALLRNTAHTASAEHKALHDSLLQRIRDLRDIQQSGELSNPELIRFLADEVIAEHIIHGDRDLVTPH